MGLLIIDGSHGEGGGQILRTSLSLSIIGARPFRLTNIRARRPNPGLLPQHLSAVRAAAELTNATVSGDQLSSTELNFAPRHTAKAGAYVFDVSQAARFGSAGSTSLVLQTLLVPLGLADGPSTLVVRGGTHVPWCPSFDDLAQCYLPALRPMGFHAEAELKRWGWYPAGGGEVLCAITPETSSGGRTVRPRPIALNRPGPLRRVVGRAVASRLPFHIPERMARRVRTVLDDLGVPVDIEPRLTEADCPGAGVFFVAIYEHIAAGFSAVGRLGIPSERIANQAADAFRSHHASGAAAELHLADQLLLPLAVASGPSMFSVAHPTGHLITNAWTLGQFGAADVRMADGPTVTIHVEPRGEPY
jgi:RNA 3'-terminal phosphate cyclase (ATP)